MKKKNIILLSSLLFVGGMTTVSLTGCERGTIETIKYGNVKVAEGIVGGSVSASKLGDVEIDTSVTIVQFLMKVMKLILIF